ncbi:integrase, truncation [Vibrio cholerae]|nr:integrase, truncation [Vibrio cholerae]
MRDGTTLIGMRKFGPFLRENEKRREHRILLTEQMLALLEVMKPISGHRDFVFPSDRDPKKPCNSQTANMGLKRMGFTGKLVSHGLRSLASTTLNEQGFDPDLVEAALAHVDDKFEVPITARIVSNVENQ